MGSLRVEHPPELGRHFCVPEWLEDDLDSGVEPSLVNDRVLRITGRIEHPEIRMADYRHLGELATVEAARKNHVREQQLRFGMGIKESQRTRAILRSQSAVAEIVKNFYRETSDIGIILDEKDSLAIAFWNLPKS